LSTREKPEARKLPERFATLGERFILGGDYNAKNTQWGSRLATTKGRELMKAINIINGNIHTTGRPTYWSIVRNKTPDVIDFYISKKIPMNCMKIEDSYDLDSDHCPIIMTVTKSLRKRQILR
jgi:endonuclease/exonuclease/phosphatase (EEP) superfamily protein YafD